MSGGNPRSAAWYRTQWSDKTAHGVVAAADSATVENIVAVKSVGHIIYVQRILFNVTTDFAASLTFQDDNSSPKVVGKSKSSPGLGLAVVADYGAEGIPLTQGKNLDIVISGAGLAGGYTIEAYEKPANAALYFGATSSASQ